MATNLTTIFGNYISVAAQPVRPDRQYVGLAGARGLLSMHLGTRGRQVAISGSIYSTGANYAAARTAMNVIISSIESYLLPGVAAADYSFGSDVYYNCVFDNFELMPDGRGKVFHWLSTGMRCDFIAVLREQSA